MEDEKENYNFCSVRPSDRCQTSSETERII